ncbi:MAG: leucine-rich repeat domain-containing protein [Candidatus Cloacimonetes bacterium]|nr:leucine-rich repeat domain-containing protein [Candidatus Cloacimonadota bacterium]
MNKFNKIIVIIIMIYSTKLYAQTTYYLGDGGMGKSLTITEFTQQGLSGEIETRIPSLLQWQLTSIFSKYTAVKVTDRTVLNEVILETLDPIYTDNNWDIISLGHILHSDYIMIGRITRTSTGFSIQISVTETKNGHIVASYSGIYTLEQIEQQSATQIIAQDIFLQMGIRITETARRELNSIVNQNQITAQINLAQGDTAQRQGTVVQALSYYFQAAILDSSLLDEINRYTITIANIDSGDIGRDARADIRWREAWQARLIETEEFFFNLLENSNPPYTLFYVPEAIERKNLNYNNQTIDIAFPVYIRANRTWFTSIMGSMEMVTKKFYDELQSTGMARNWGLANWPNAGVSNRNPYNRAWNKDIQIVFELVNDQNRVIGRWNNNIPFSFSMRNMQTVFNDHQQQIEFRGVNANEVSSRLEIRIISINGVSPQNAKFPIKTLTKAQFEESIRLESENRFVVENGVLKGYSNTYLQNNRLASDRVRVLSIPALIFKWDEVHQISSIGEGAFANQRIGRVIISKSIHTISDGAFRDNNISSIEFSDRIIRSGERYMADLSNITLYDVNVVSIGNHAFQNNWLRVLNLPESVTNIGDNAFYGNYLAEIVIDKNIQKIGRNAFTGMKCPWTGRNQEISKITISDKVKLLYGAFSDSFMYAYYNDTGRKAGRYESQVFGSEQNPKYYWRLYDAN